MNNPTTAHDILADLDAKLDKSKRSGDTLMARCPAHEDTIPSLSVTIGDNDDCVILKCFGGCMTEDVVAALRVGDARPVRRDVVTSGVWFTSDQRLDELPQWRDRDANANRG